MIILSEFEWRGWEDDSSDRDRIPEGERISSDVSWGVGREKAQEEAHMDRAQDQEAPDVRKEGNENGIHMGSGTENGAEGKAPC